MSKERVDYLREFLGHAKFGITDRERKAICQESVYQESSPGPYRHPRGNAASLSPHERSTARGPRSPSARRLQTSQQHSSQAGRCSPQDDARCEYAPRKGRELEQRMTKVNYAEMLAREQMLAQEEIQCAKEEAALARDEAAALRTEVERLERAEDLRPALLVAQRENRKSQELIAALRTQLKDDKEKHAREISELNEQLVAYEALLDDRRSNATPTELSLEEGFPLSLVDTNGMPLVSTFKPYGVVPSKVLSEAVDRQRELEAENEALLCDLGMLQAQISTAMQVEKRLKQANARAAQAAASQGEAEMAAARALSRMTSLAEELDSMKATAGPWLYEREFRTVQTQTWEDPSQEALFLRGPENALFPRVDPMLTLQCHSNRRRTHAGRGAN